MLVPAPPNLLPVTVTAEIQTTQKKPHRHIFFNFPNFLQLIYKILKIITLFSLSQILITQLIQGYRKLNFNCCLIGINKNDNNTLQTKNVSIVAPCKTFPGSSPSLFLFLLLPAFTDCYRSIVLGHRSAVCLSQPSSRDRAIGEVCPIDRFCTKRKR